MTNRKKILGMFGLLLAVGLVSGLVSATPYYKKVGPYTWYGEDYETNGFAFFGGGWAYASAYFHVKPPCYWYNGKNSGGVYGDADLVSVVPRNGLYSVETDTYFDILGAAMKVVASVGIPPEST